MKKFRYGIAILVLFQLAAVGVWASKEDCGEPPNVPAKPATEVNNEDPNVQNDYDEVIEEEVDSGITYLTFINGAQPKANACGLNPSNDPAQWTGWGGPIDADNMTIGEGAGTRNDIVIGGVLFERGIGTHAIATIVYPLTGDQYVKFEGYAGMSDEKDPAECGHGGTCDFVFDVDGKTMAKVDQQMGTDGGENLDPVFVEFDIPGGAKELTITIGNGGDGAISCDHGCIGDAKLLTSGARAVEPGDKATSTWGRIKASY